MARTVLDIFLSSTGEDLRDYREAVHARLKRIDFFHCIRQEDFGAQDAEAIAFCREKSAIADLFVGLVGMRRGWEPEGDNAKRSITEMEHDWARDAGRRRYIWVAPDNFPVPGNLHESAVKHKRQRAFRKRIMAAGERIVSQRGFDSAATLASEITEQLLTHVVTSDLITLLRPEFARREVEATDDHEPAVTAAVERLADDQDVDLLALASDPTTIDIDVFESKLRVRADKHEDASRVAQRASAEYWCHIGALAFLHDTHKALAAYEKAAALDPQNVEPWRFIGELQFRLGQLDAAAQSFERILGLGRSSDDLQAQAVGLLRLGWIARIHGDLTSAERFFEQSRSAAERANWQQGLAHAHSNLGNVLQIRGDLAKAEATHLKALELDKELGNRDGMARAYGNLGIVYDVRGDLDRAEEMQRKALALDQELGNKYGMARCYGGLGEIHQARGDFAKAEEMQLKALKLDQELDDKEGMAQSYANLGLIYEQTGDKTRMCDCWRKERDLYLAMGLPDEVAKVARTLKLKGCGEN